MANQTVNVTADFAAGTVQIDREQITMDEAGTITFSPSGSGDTFTFAAFAWCPTTANSLVGIRDFSITIQQGQIVVGDTDADAGDYYYQVGVVNPQNPTQIYWSPDPEITNQRPPAIRFT